MRKRFLLTGLLTALLATGCLLPVNPVVNFTPYQNPYIAREEFDRLLTSWKGGRAVTWQVRYRGSAFSDSELVIASDGSGSLGPRLPGTGTDPQDFTLSKADLTKLADALMASGIFSLYDGHYGAYTQSGGVGGPEIIATVSNIQKRVSKDPGLSPAVSWEAGAIQAASDTLVEIARAKIK